MNSVTCLRSFDYRRQSLSLGITSRFRDVDRMRVRREGFLKAMGERERLWSWPEWWLRLKKRR